MFIAGADSPVVRPSLSQAERTIGSAANFIGIGVALAVIFPEADGADIEGPALMERATAAAWATNERTRTFHGSYQQQCPSRSN
jgi:hypothetical protein